jgi:hypothetical protein
MTEKRPDEAKILFRVPKEMHRWFKFYALRHDKTMSAILKEHLEELRRQDEHAFGNAHTTEREVAS